jgi:ATP-dependent metalloprotease
LDKALLRPGRFDVQVNVPVPDFIGRKDIFKLYLSKIVHENINVTALAKGTTGFTGADIENMVNQAALKAATEGAKRVAMRHLEDAKDRILMGPARLKGRIPDEETNKNTAHHEAGHTIVAYFTPDAMPIHKVTIIPRGQSLGHTAFLPEKDTYQQTKAQILAQIDVAMGGRVAEELAFGIGKITTGAGDDLKRATDLAVAIVKQFGMGERVGLRNFASSFETNGIVAVNDLGPQTSEAIDQEINRILQESYTRAKDIIVKHKNEHQLLADALFEHETLNAKEITAVIKGEKLGERVYQPPRQSPLSGRRKLPGKPQIHVRVEEE